MSTDGTDTQPTIPPIQTREDFDRVVADLDVRLKQLRFSGSSRPVVEAAILQDLHALQDRNSNAPKFMREEQFKRHPELRELGPNEATELRKIVHSVMAALNTKHGTHFPDPVLIVDHASPGNLGYMHAEDALHFDSVYQELAKSDPQAMRTIIAHELAHSFQDNAARIILKYRGQSFPYLAQLRQDELDADHESALLTSPEAVLRSMKINFTMQSHAIEDLTVEQLIKTQNLTFEEATEKYNKLMPEERTKLMAQVANLSPEKKEALSQDWLKDSQVWEKTYELFLDHPSHDTRIAQMQQMIEERHKSSKTPHVKTPDHSELLKHHDFNNPHGNLGGVEPVSAASTVQAAAVPMAALQARKGSVIS